MKEKHFINEIATVKDFKSGDLVIYVPQHAIEDYEKCNNYKDLENGIVSSVTELVVFVKYVKNGWISMTSQSTNPKDLVKRI